MKQPNHEAHGKMVLMKFLSCLSDLSSLFANNGWGRSSSNLHYSFNFSIHLYTLENSSPSFIFFSVCCLNFSPTMLKGETVCTFVLQPFPFPHNLFLRV